MNDIVKYFLLLLAAPGVIIIVIVYLLLCYDVFMELYSHFLEELKELYNKFKKK